LTDFQKFFCFVSVRKNINISKLQQKVVTHGCILVLNLLYYNGMGSTKHRKEHKGANSLKNTRISTTRDHKEHKEANLFTYTRISTTRDQLLKL